jgi:hypothetical protein
MEAADMTDTTISTDPATLRDLAATLRMDEVRVCPHYLKLDLLADTFDAIAAEKEAHADLTRRLAEVTAERDEWLALAKRFETRQGKLVVMAAEVRVRAETAEAALSRRDEALRVAREALDRIVEHGSAMGPAGTATMLEIARAAIDALTKPQEARP